MATLHFICGKPGAGKTTLARELGVSLPAIVLCEDEWIFKLGFEIRSLEEYREVSGRCRKLIGSLAGDLLRLGVPVVLDFAANTLERRAWVRSLFEAAGADHALHWIEASDAECLDNIHRRNDEKPAGIYWGQVSNEMFHAITPHVVPPSHEEGFHIVRHLLHSRTTSVAAPGATDEIAKFQGTWKQIGYERDGVIEPHDEEDGWQPRTTFVGNTYVVTIADGSNPIKGTFTVDPTKEPKAVDYTDTFGADAGKTFPAIYYFEGDRLVFCAAGSGQERPAAFKTRRGEVLRVHVRTSPGGGDAV